jgi:hypothetical protein
MNAAGFPETGMKKQLGENLMINVHQPLTLEVGAFCFGNRIFNMH